MIKFELVKGIALIEATVNGIKGQMAFDTGAFKTTLNKKYFSQLSGERSSVVTYNDELLDSDILETKVTLEINNQSWEQDVNVLNFDYVEKPLQESKKNLKFLGTLGIDIIRNHNFIIDYISRTIEFKNITKNDDFILSIPFHFEKLPIVDVVINKSSYRFVLDTGASHCVIDKHLSMNQELNDNQDNELTIPTLRIGDLDLLNIKAVSNDLSQLKEKLNADGIIGYDIFKEHRYYFDFNKNRIYLLQ